MDTPALQIVPRMGGFYYAVVAGERIMAQGDHELCQRVLNEGPCWMLVPLVCPICEAPFTLRHDQLMELAEGLRVSPEAVVPVCVSCQENIGDFNVVDISEIKAAEDDLIIREILSNG